MYRSVRVKGSGVLDRKSTRLNSSHLVISYAVFCLKKKNGTLLAYREGKDGGRKHSCIAPRNDGQSPYVVCFPMLMIFFLKNWAAPGLSSFSLHAAFPI